MTTPSRLSLRGMPSAGMCSQEGRPWCMGGAATTPPLPAGRAGAGARAGPGAGTVGPVTHGQRAAAAAAGSCDCSNAGSQAGWSSRGRDRGGAPSVVTCDGDADRPPRRAPSLRRRKGRRLSQALVDGCFDGAVGLAAAGGGSRRETDEQGWEARTSWRSHTLHARTGRTVRICAAARAQHNRQRRFTGAGGPCLDGAELGPGGALALLQREQQVSSAEVDHAFGCCMEGGAWAGGAQ